MKLTVDASGSSSTLAATVIECKQHRARHGGVCGTKTSNLSKPESSVANIDPRTGVCNYTLFACRRTRYRTLGVHRRVLETYTSRSREPRLTRLRAGSIRPYSVYTSPQIGIRPADSDNAKLVPVWRSDYTSTRSLYCTSLRSRASPLIGVAVPVVVWTCKVPVQRLRVAKGAHLG
ncbi:hypothetical protein BDV95DRAFT_346440 [Massariosphaeria phaeospora]|uniref:Uncharacterized protein n=1 Tax=Massariosphaeria phaeospora TaxID=100035 RepID=A0A7C8I8T2_9PLEO|nr:hypothetical protein BDV95DRAFT_346440 [Massariosphaeria phaeospora]